MGILATAAGSLFLGGWQPYVRKHPALSARGSVIRRRRCDCNRDCLLISACSISNIRGPFSSPQTSAPPNFQSHSEVALQHSLPHIRGPRLLLLAPRLFILDQTIFGSRTTLGGYLLGSPPEHPRERENYHKHTARHPGASDTATPDRKTIGVPASVNKPERSRLDRRQSFVGRLRQTRSDHALTRCLHRRPHLTTLAPNTLWTLRRLALDIQRKHSSQPPTGSRTPHLRNSTTPQDHHDAPQNPPNNPRLQRPLPLAHAHGPA